MVVIVELRLIRKSAMLRRDDVADKRIVRRIVGVNTTGVPAKTPKKKATKKKRNLNKTREKVRCLGFGKEHSFWREIGATGVRQCTKCRTKKDAASRSDPGLRQVATQRGSVVRCLEYDSGAFN